MPDPALARRAQELYEEIILAHASGQVPLTPTLIEAKELARDENLSEEWQLKLIMAANVMYVTQNGERRASIGDADMAEFGYDRSEIVTPRDVLRDIAVARENARADGTASDTPVRRSGIPGTLGGDPYSPAGAQGVADQLAEEAGTTAATMPPGVAPEREAGGIDFTGRGASPNQAENFGRDSGPFGNVVPSRLLINMDQESRDQAINEYLGTAEGRRVNADLQRRMGIDLPTALARQNIEIDYRIDANGVGSRTRDGHSRFLSWQSLSRLVDALPHHELVTLQERLWDAGFYHGEEPNWGVRDMATREAFNESLVTAQATSDSYTWDEMMEAYTGIESANQAQAQQKAIDEAMRGAGLDVQTVSDPATIRMNANDMATQLIGRQLTIGERDAFAGWIRGLERSNNEQRRQRVGQHVIEQAQEEATGAGRYNTERVGQVGAQLGSAFGLTVASHLRTPEHNQRVGGARNSDHLRGMAVDLAGDPQQMEALYRWAKANEGPNGLFRIVLYKYEDPQGHDDHVHLSFNTHVETPVALPGASTAGIPVTGYSQGLGDFMAAIRSVESGGNYRAQGPTTRYGRATGAYQFLDSTWNGYGGYRSARDAPSHVQDERAAQLMMAYYRQFGDWQLVAVAWHAGPGAAQRAQRDRAYLNRLSDGNMTTARYVQAVMGTMANGGRRPPVETRFLPAQERRENTRPAAGKGEGGGKWSQKVLAGLDQQAAAAFQPTMEEEQPGAQVDLGPAVEVEEFDPDAAIREELVGSQDYADYGLMLSIEDFNRLIAGPFGQ